MKKVSSFLLLSFLCFQLNAQESLETNSSKGFLTISIGPSFPFGDFASTDVNEFDAGFANNGLSINLINFGYLFSKNAGITVMLAGSAYPLDVQSTNDPLWSYGTLLVGPLLTFPLSNEDVLLDLRAMVGTLTATLDPDDGSGSFDGSGGAFSLGGAIRYHLSDKISLAGGADFISSNPEFEINGVEFDQPVSSLNLTIGISFRL